MANSMGAYPLHPEINVALLQALVPAEADEFTAMLQQNLGSDTELAQALRDIQQNERQERTRAAAQEIQNLIRRSESAIVNSVNQLRDLRAEEVKLRQHLANIERARQYGYETMNFLPLVGLLTGKATGHAVPADWKPKTPIQRQKVPRKSTRR